MTESSIQSTSNRSTWILLAMLLAIVGVGLSLYSTLHHLEVHATGQTSAACNISAKFNCDEVALSKYSEVAGIPLGVLGLGYFTALLLLLGAAWSGIKAAADHLHAYAALVGIGVLTSVGLGGIAIALIGTYCLVCMAIYAVTLAQLALLFAGRRSLIPAGITFKSIGNGGTSALIAVDAVIGLFHVVKPAHLPEVLDLPQTAENSAKAQPQPAISPKAQDIPVSKSAYSSLGEDYRKGSDQAKVVVVEFADFQCPACGVLARNVRQLHEEFGDRVLFVFRNYPLDNSCNSSIPGKMHEYSCKAAVLARCAGSYGKFWQYHDQLFDHQQDINDAKLKQWALAIGLKSDQIETCLNSKDIVAKVKDDVALGNRLALDSTPTVFINGVKVVAGHGIEQLRNQIASLLN